MEKVASDHKMIPGRRNRKMKITADRLKQIIIEEYLKEEMFDESQAAEDLLRQLIGDEEYERRRALDNPDSRGGDTAAMDKPNKASKTMAIDMDTKADDMPQYDEEGAYDPEAEADSGVHPVKAAVDGIYELVSDMEPEDVAEIFQIVFEKLPGVEMKKEPENPGTLYTPGSEGRPQAGFKLQELQELIRRVFRDV